MVMPKATEERAQITYSFIQKSSKARAYKLQGIINLAHRNMEQCTQEQRHHCNLRRRKWKPQTGEIATDQFAAKLALRCVGLHTVNSYVSPVIVTLKDDCTNRTTHIFDLNPVKAGTTTSTHSFQNPLGRPPFFILVKKT
uniref:Uncharacterized protein n=1 Tax=Glossina morsitans morsitans TaxID=37546 RepID=A0A1B0FJ87_GLOMM